MKMKNLVTIMGILVAVSANAGQPNLDRPEIIGGTLVGATATTGQRTVGLYFNVTENGQQGAAVCSGSILDSSHILTAAHCVDSFQSGYVIFSTDMFKQLKQASTGGIASTHGLVAKMTSAVAKPGFPGMANANNGGEFVDLAIITFAGGLPAGYQPAKFLAKATVLAALDANKTVTLSGYGMTSAPAPEAAAAAPTPRPRTHSAESRVLATGGSSDTGFPAGVGILRQVAVKFDSYSARQIDLELVGKRNHIACEGDSGGPATISYQGETYVIGVDSRGDCSENAIYTLVDQENATASR